MTRHKYFLIATILCVCGAACAEVYKYIDEDGNIVFTDDPPENADGEVVELPSFELPSTPIPIGRVRPNQQRGDDIAETDRNRIDKLVQEQVSDHGRRCTEARIALEVLHQGMPVYRVGDGEYRAAWVGDTFEGTRFYLSDEQREATINEQLRKLGLNCVDPLNEEQHEQAATRWYNKEMCVAARADLERLLKPSSRESDQSIEKGWEVVGQYCSD